jgi:hypothetical protein
LTVDARQSSPSLDAVDPYEGSVVLRWDDPAVVAVEGSSWGSLKAFFR